MKVTPILFSTPMVQAILDGSKKQTRRTKGLEFINDSYSSWEYLGLDELGHLMRNEHGATNAVKCPYGEIGDVLWVRETFYAFGVWVLVDGKWYFDDCTNQFQKEYLFENCKPEVIEQSRNSGLGWYKRPSLFMPKAACRIFLKITNVRVERLQDISEEDAKAEGVFIHAVYPSPRMEFANLWESINGKESWNANPWVWVIEFERIEKPENFK
jgi:hypothetical protein